MGRKTNCPENGRKIFGARPDRKLVGYCLPATGVGRALLILVRTLHDSSRDFTEAFDHYAALLVRTWRLHTFIRKMDQNGKPKPIQP